MLLDPHPKKTNGILQIKQSMAFGQHKSLISKLKGNHDENNRCILNITAHMQHYDTFNIIAQQRHW